MLKKWQLVSSEDVSPSKWFPLEKRTYQLPDGKIVENFYVTTLADSVHVIALTKDKRVVLIKMYKQGVDEIMIQFPAGRFEAQKHQDHLDVAVQELREEAGIKVDKSQLQLVGRLALMSTKATERIPFFLVTNVEFNAEQKLDENEEIETLTLSPQEMDQYISTGKIWDALCIAGWELAKKKFPKELGY